MPSIHRPAQSPPSTKRMLFEQKIEEGGYGSAHSYITLVTSKID
ncbi:MAG: hypothetical protein ACFFHV_14370 [Promethearchaeota archaeon]